MPVPLYELSVETYLQVVGGVEGFLEKGKRHCHEHGIDLDEVVASRVYPDMLPFQYQVLSVVNHSIGSIEALESGQFAPSRERYGEPNYEGLQQWVSKAKEKLNAYNADQVAGFENNSITLKLTDRSIPFTAKNFVMSFSLPNLFFHTVTAYNILRIKGAPVGKTDFMGAVRIGV